MARKVRVLVVGVGNMGLSHAKAYESIDGFELVGLMSRSIGSRTDLPAQLVAVPTLEGLGVPLDNLALSCPNVGGCAYNAYWDGTVRTTGRLAASGVYIYQLIVDGRRFTKKMIVMK